MSPGEGRHTIARRWRPARGRTPGKDKNKIGTPARGDIMRGVNIHVDFVMIQCTKNKNLTPLRINNTYGGMPPCYRPQQLRCFGLRDSFLPLPRVPLLTQLHHVATGPSPLYHGALKFGSLRSQYHIKLPDKLQFIGEIHLSTVIFYSAYQFIQPNC